MTGTELTEQDEDESVREGNRTEALAAGTEGEPVEVLRESRSVFFTAKFNSFLHPASVIQSIIEDVQAVHILQSHFRIWMRS